MSRPQAPTRTGLVAVVSERVTAAFPANEVQVSPEEYRAVSEWAHAWSEWYRRGGGKPYSRVRDGRHEMLREGEWRDMLGMDGCRLVCAVAQQGLFG